MGVWPMSNWIELTSTGPQGSVFFYWSATRFASRFYTRFKTAFLITPMSVGAQKVTKEARMLTMDQMSQRFLVWKSGARIRMDGMLKSWLQ
jgi:hypothetical protein